MGDEKRIQKLIQQLGSEDRFMRNRTAQDLGNIGDASAVPALIGALKDKDRYVRHVVAKALGMIGDASAVPALIEALNDEDAELRWMAAEALRIIGDASAVPELICALNDENWDVRFKAFDAILKFFRDCNSTEDVLDFENKVSEGLVRLRDKCRDNGKTKRAEFQVIELKKKAAKKKNDLAGKKDLLLPDKPKPPKKGQMFRRLERARNG